jgi:hypothetical protein
MPFSISKKMKTQVYLIGTSVCFFSYDSAALPTPTTTFIRAVPAALLTIDNAPTADYITFSQQDNTGGLPSPFLSVLFADIVNSVGVAYTSITTMIAAITPASSGGTVTAPNIATYEVQYDEPALQFVRVLTIFNPVTNAPTRIFFELDGVTPYTPTVPASVFTFDYFLKNIERATGNLLFFATKGESTCKVNMSVVSGENTVVTSPTTTELQVIALTGTFDITDSSGLSNTTTFPITTVTGGIIAEYNISAGEYRYLEPITIDIPIGASVLIIEKV